MQPINKNVFLLMTMFVAFSSMYGMEKVEKNANIKGDGVEKKEMGVHKIRSIVVYYLISCKAKDFVFENLNSEYGTYCRVCLDKSSVDCNKNKSYKEMIRESFVNEGNKQLEEFLSILGVKGKDTQELRTIIKRMGYVANSFKKYNVKSEKEKGILSMFMLFAKRRLKGKFSSEMYEWVSIENKNIKILKKD